MQLGISIKCICVKHLPVYCSAGAKEVNASGKTFTVRSSVQLQVDRNDDGVAYTCKVVHEALRSVPQQITEVLEVHCKSCPKINLRLLCSFYFHISFHRFIFLLSEFLLVRWFFISFQFCDICFSLWNIFLFYFYIFYFLNKVFIHM